MNLDNLKTSSIHFIGIISVVFFMGLFISACEKDEIPSIPSGTQCDSTDVSFSTVIVPILEANCTSCHSDGNALAGVNLSGHANVIKSVNDNSLVPSLTGSMKSYISNPCEISQIRAWVNEGAKNN